MVNLKNQEIIPGTIWFTGISGSGKTTLGKFLYDAIIKKGFDADFLDGDELRKRFDKQYGHSLEDRFEVAKRIIDIASKCNKEGKIAIVSTVSHKKKMRDMARQNIYYFMEVYLNCPVNVCKDRDYKGLYEKAYINRDELFPGVTEPYEVSENPELILNTASEGIEQCGKILLKKVLRFLRGKGVHI
jgi:adenylyl-sulfate kinase|tara:strand:- start:762 stop:1322 length:561 start_codon:yes stop_codon:yes gene_type:complete